MVTFRLSLALAAALLAWIALPGTFVFDDHSLAVDPAVTGPDAWRQWIAPERTRPLTYMSFWLDHAIWEHNAAGFRFTNWVIHLGTALALAAALLRLVPAVAWPAALLFALHPLAHQPLFYVFARSSSLAALFALLALRSWAGGSMWIATAWFGISLAAKEEWVALPAVLFLIDRARGRTPRWKPLAAMVLLALGAGLRVVWATAAVAGAGSGFGQDLSPWRYLVTQGQVIPGYLWRFFLPFSMTIDPQAPSANLEAGVLFWVLSAVAAVLWWRSSGGLERPWFWAGIALVLLLPSSSVLPAADGIAWRRCYLPAAVGCVAIALALRDRPWGVAIAAAALAAFAAGERAAWQSETQLWQDAAAAAPEKLRPQLQLARLLAPAEASHALQRAKEIAPDSAEVASEEGRVWLRIGDPARALAGFGRALALAPNEPRHMQNRGVALLLLGQREAAAADFRRALERDPCLKPARENLDRLGIATLPPPKTCPITSSDAR